MATSREEPTMLNTGERFSELSQKETRQQLTPFAFEIDQSLFGMALASPWRRLMAILVDLAFIALLAGAPGELLALVVALTFFRLGSQKHVKKMGKNSGDKRRKLLRVTGIIVLSMLLFSVLLDILAPQSRHYLADEASEGNSIVTIDGKPLSLEEGIAFSTLTTALLVKVNTSDCQTVTCWHLELMEFVAAASEFELSNESLNDALSSIGKATGLAEDEQMLLIEKLSQDYQKSTQQLAKSLDSSVPSEEPTKELDNLVVNTTEVLQTDVDEVLVKSSQEKQTYSIIELVKGVANDLGLGFGWAAFYFTAFTALWQGQTPGKKLFSIRVLQLDGTPLSFWDSFGRYGGYGAGISTGLLGFIQIFWDANRQAIHDKISTTVVINSKTYSHHHRHAQQNES